MPITPEELIETSNSGVQTRDYETDLISEPPYWRNWPETFDYVLWIDFADALKPQLKQLELLTTGSYFSIYRVVRP